jgi:S-adenosylmethionine:diacylglycerol 3-amino-3-carboxypropyl transferase
MQPVQTVDDLLCVAVLQMPADIRTGLHERLFSRLFRDLVYAQK